MQGYHDDPKGFTFADKVREMHSHLGELEDAARKLPNQNAADLIKAARGRLAQLAEHPDIEKVGDQLREDARSESEKGSG